MKKTKFVSLVAAMFAASTLLSSCWCHEDSASTDVTEVETGVVTYSITVQSNVATEVIVGSQIKKIPAEGGEVVFENLTDSKYEVKATALVDGEFLPSKAQKVDVEFTEEKVSSVVTFNFVSKDSKSAVTKNLGIDGKVATELVVKNDAAAEVVGTQETIPATLTVPASTTLTDANGDPMSGDQTFSVVAYTLPIAQDEELPEEQVTPAVTLECQPDGAQFSNDVTLKAYIGIDAAGANVDVNGTEYTVDNEGYVTFTVNHFSAHTVGLKTKNTYTVETITLADQKININEGENEFTYERYFGWTPKSNLGSFFSAWHAAVFGLMFTQKESVTAKFDATSAGTGSIKITQELIHYTIKTGILTFYTDVYGAVTVTVISDDGQGASAHSGGSGN